jgi:hypothetical protein
MSEMNAIIAVGRIQAIAFAEGGSAVPVFLTDLAGGFRAWIVINSALYELHPPDRALTLAEGVALIRLFLERAHADEPTRVVRGGAWNSSPALCRAASRETIGAAAESSSVGFRLVRTAP